LNFLVIQQWNALNFCIFEFGHEFSFLLISLDKKPGVPDRQKMTPAEKVFPAQKVEEFCVNVLTKAGLSTNWSAIVAESLYAPKYAP